MDIASALAAEPPSLTDLLEVWDSYSMRQMLAQSIAQGADAELLKRALAAPAATALEALQANEILVRLLTGWRWSAMRQAREDGRSWAEIGSALGMTRQSAWEFYNAAVARQKKHAPDYLDSDRADVALADASGLLPNGLLPGCICTIDYRGTSDEQRTLNRNCQIHGNPV